MKTWGSKELYKMMIVNSCCFHNAEAVFLIDEKNLRKKFIESKTCPYAVVCPFESLFLMLPAYCEKLLRFFRIR